MNRNSRKGLGFVFALFGLLVAVPIIGIFAIIGTITYFIILKRRQNESKVEDLRAQANNDRENQVINTQYVNTDDYGYLTNSKRRLEDLKSLYDNGFISKDEYIEKRNKLINGI